MAQHDMNIANQGFPATRADLNNALQAIATNNSGTSAPSTTFANQWFYNTSSNKLFIRNEANNAFIEVATLDQTNNEWQITTGVVQAKDSDGLALKTDDGTTRLFVKDSDGFIGVGNSSPTAPLHVSDTSSGITGRFSNDVNQTLDLGTVSGVAAGGSVFIDNANSGNILFRSGGNERMRMLAAGGLTFNGDTAAVNALNDYEEGSHVTALSPTSSGSITLSASNKTLGYIKIGKIVHVFGYVRVDSVSSPVGTFRITLPFTVENDNRSRSAVNIKMNNTASLALYNFWAIAENNTAFVEVYNGTANSVAANSAQQVQASTDLRISVTYRTA